MDSSFCFAFLREIFRVFSFKNYPKELADNEFLSPKHFSFGFKSLHRYGCRYIYRKNVSGCGFTCRWSSTMVPGMFALYGKMRGARGGRADVELALPQSGWAGARGKRTSRRRYYTVVSHSLLLWLTISPSGPGVCARVFAVK